MDAYRGFLRGAMGLGIAVAFSWLGACSSEGASQSSDSTPAYDCTGGKCDAWGSPAPVAAPTWARVWFEPSAEEGKTNLVWRVVESGVLSPAYVHLVVRDASGNSLGNFGAAAGEGEKTAYTFDTGGEKAPVALEVLVSLPYEHDIEGFGLTVLEGRLDLDAEDHTRGNPLLLRCPFDLWPVRLFGEARLFVLAMQQSVSLEPYRGADKSSLEMRSSIVVGAGDLKTLYLAAPQQGTVLPADADVYDADGVKHQVATEVPAPGVYMAGEAGLRRATEEELSNILRAQGCGASGKPCCMDDPACQDGLCVDGTCQSDCGAVGSACCGGPGGTCAVGAHCSADTCEACGALEQACCGGVGGTCGALLACSAEGRCEPCGGEGQPCCDGGVCEGAACVQGSCRADCGAAGALCCDGYGGACEDGAYCPPSQTYCRACGGPTQECCGGYGGTCDDGAYCPNSQMHCRACGEPGQECCGGYGGTCESGAHCAGAQCVSD